MTLDEIKRSDKDFLTPAEIAPVLRCDPNVIRITAKSNPPLLGFPVTVVGHRAKIPRKPFIAFVEGEYTEKNGG